MMSSLVPGAIFYSPGFNRKSTPTPPNISPAELDNRYRRVDFDGHEWPHDSPVSRTYDVSNTSTKLIILNNKYGKNSTRLRGYYTGPKRSERFIDPGRHRAKSPRNPDFHQMCLDSSTPRFEPDPRTALDWETGSYSPPQSLTARSSVNPRRHMSCQVPSRTPLPGTDRPRSVRSALPPARYFSEFSDLSVGEKLYLWSIEKIYNVENLKQLKQEQYKALLKQEMKKGYYRPSDYEKYMRYINSASSRRYGTGPSSGNTSRARSAFSHRSGRSSPTKSDTRSDNDKDKEKERESDRPKTAAPATRGDRSDTDKEDTSEKNPRSETDKDETSEKNQVEKDEDEKRSYPRPIAKSPSPSRKSNTSSRSPSAKSQRSKSGSRASSARSVKSSGKPVTSEESEQPERQHHKEGVDRPKSRLGHKSADDKDSESVEE